MDIQDCLAALDSKVPLSAPVTFSLLPVMNKHGTSWFDDKAQCFVITISPNRYALDLMAVALMEEWAHCLTECDCIDEHCDHWGAAFARCKRALIASSESPG